MTWEELLLRIGVIEKYSDQYKMGFRVDFYNRVPEYIVKLLEKLEKGEDAEHD